jgi:hypothetical protein
MCLLTIKGYLDFCHYNSASLEKRHYYSPNVNNGTKTLWKAALVPLPATSHGSLYTYGACVFAVWTKVTCFLIATWYQKEGGLCFTCIHYRKRIKFRGP